MLRACSLLSPALAGPQVGNEDLQNQKDLGRSVTTWNKQAGVRQWTAQWRSAEASGSDQGVAGNESIRKAVSDPELETESHVEVVLIALLLLTAIISCSECVVCNPSASTQGAIMAGQKIMHGGESSPASRIGSATRPGALAERKSSPSGRSCASASTDELMPTVRTARRLVRPAAVS